MKGYGLVAQLGERSVRIREVEGSNPFRSTKNPQIQVICGFFIIFFAIIYIRLFEQSDKNYSGDAYQAPQPVRILASF